MIDPSASCKDVKRAQGVRLSMREIVVFLRRRQVSPEVDKLFAAPQGPRTSWLFIQKGGTPRASGDGRGGCKNNHALRYAQGRAIRNSRMTSSSCQLLLPRSRRDFGLTLYFVGGTADGGNCLDVCGGMASHAIADLCVSVQMFLSRRREKRKRPNSATPWPLDSSPPDRS
jgi:hypothetical protein